MAEVTLDIGGRSYTIACRDGGEEHLRTIARHVDRKAREAHAAVGNVTESRQLLFAALLLADQLAEAVGGTIEPQPDSLLIASLEGLADRIERVADALEDAG